MAIKPKQVADFIIIHDGDLKECKVIPLVNGKIVNVLAVAVFPTVSDAQAVFRNSTVVQLISEQTSLSSLPPTAAMNARRLFAKAKLGLLDSPL